MLESVINISEGIRTELIAEIAATAGADLLDVHSCVHHNRSVLTVIGEHAARAIARSTVELLDLSTHTGAHPRIGVLDVVPFIALDGTTVDEAIVARDSFARWAGETLGLPCFVYGPERTLPEIRRGAFTSFPPDHGPAQPHPSAGAVAVGQRPPLVAYNLWLADADLDLATQIARSIRSASVRALGLSVGDRVQVSMNLIDPAATGPAQVWDQVAASAPIERAELVGLIPAEALTDIDPRRWTQLDVSVERTIEWRLTQRKAEQAVEAERNDS
jgi:glutamate formiminotransferase